jgi:hypothetical protein
MVNGTRLTALPDAANRPRRLRPWSWSAAPAMELRAHPHNDAGATLMTNECRGARAVPVGDAGTAGDPEE